MTRRPTVTVERADPGVLRHHHFKTGGLPAHGDPITGPMGPILQKVLPGAQDREHPTIENAGHFLQEDAGPELAAAVVAFMTATPAK